MIAASEPVEYIPGGREVVQRHPKGDATLYHDDCAPRDSSLSHKFSNVNISGKSKKESWVVRENDSCEEEELYFSGKVAVHMKGSQSSRILKTSYMCETDIKHAFWYSFELKTPDICIKKDKHKKQILVHKDESVDDEEKNIDEEDKPVSSVCLIDSYTLKTFSDTGEDYVSSLQFQVTGVWPTKYGILLEKNKKPMNPVRYSVLDLNKSLLQNEMQLPIYYSQTHPLDEVRPVLIKHGSTSYMIEPGQYIVFTSSEPSLVMIYDKRTNLHSVYKIRKVTATERRLFCGDVTNVQDNNTIWKNSPRSHTNIFSNSGLGLSPMFGLSPIFGSYSNTSPSMAQQYSYHPSRSQSSTPTIPRCSSPTDLPFFDPNPFQFVASSAQQARTQHKNMLASLLKQQSGPISSHNFNSASLHENSCISGKSVYPEIIFDHFWTESNHVPKDTFMERATKVFLTTDLVNQNYLGYLVPNRSQVFLVRLEKSNPKQQVIFGKSTSIIAKDAVNLPKMNMIAIMDMSKCISLYSGTMFVGKVYIPNLMTSFPNSSNNTPGVMPRSVSSPFPRRSSLLVGNFASPVPINKLEEDVNLLSPVGAPVNRSVTFMDSSLVEGQLMGFKDAVGNKLILQYGNQSYYKVTLPFSSSSPLVTKCLHTLKSVLQRDLALQLLVKWYSTRNAPGPQNFSPTQEWHLFLVVLFTLFGYEVDKLHLIQLQETDTNADYLSPVLLSKKQRTSDCGSHEDWLYVLNSEQHKKSKHFFTESLGLSNLPTLQETPEFPCSKVGNANRMNTQASLFLYLPLVLFALHLLYEELKLNSEMSESLPLLAQLLHQLSSDLRFDHYADYYFRDFPKLCHQRKPSQISEASLQKITAPNYVTKEPPSVFETMYKLLNYVNIKPYPYLNQVNLRTKNIIHLTAMVAHEGEKFSLDMKKLTKLIVPAGSRMDLFEMSVKVGEKDEQKVMKPLVAGEIVLSYHNMGMTKQDLENLPPAVALIFKDLLYRCREKPPSNWPKEVYELVDRQDFAILETNSGKSAKPKNETNDLMVADAENDDGMDFDDAVLKLRFNKDHRVAEVRKLLGSSQPVKIAIVQRPDVSDHDFIEEQERHLHALCTRTMALPVGRGMFTLRTSVPIITEQLPIPKLCITGKAPPRGTTVELNHIDVPQNMNLWPLFHNGVAAGLRIHPDATDIDSTWILYNKQVQGDLGLQHSGFLMALGLNGHLKCLSPFNVYEYLTEYNEIMSVGILLGLAATYRGTMNICLTKVLSLHVEALLPPTSIDLNVHQNIQIASLIGVGLLYQRTAHRHIAHSLLSEIGRPPGPEMKNCVDREAYSLAAGMALGLVVLGQGEGSSDLEDIPDTLHYYMIGGNVRPFTGSQKDKYKSPSYQIREGDSINIDVTSPGATIALGLMYFNSGNRAVAEWMRAPDTQYLLDFVRPDFLLLRILARSLILWDEIQPTKKWILSHVPEIVLKHRLHKPTPENMQEVDLETMNQAYCNIVAGACMALGLKYAGTANQNAFKALYHYAELFTILLYKSIAELAGKSTVETCLNVILLSASVVMAGTGNLEIMRICRHIRTRIGPASSVVTYGSHLATHMALGFLFLGGGRYTLSNSPEAVAALIISIFPKFPTHSNDNRYHLQPFRHFYVLAAEPRLLLPKDIDNREFCYATVHLTFASEKEAEGQEVVLKAPCLLPQLDSLTKVVLKDDRYWQIIFDKSYNWDLLMKMLENCQALFVKQRAGCLSYEEDPNGFRSLVAQTLTTENVVVWAAPPEHITSFTNDKTILNMVKYFLKDTIKETHEDGDNADLSFDRVIQDSSKHLINGTLSFETAVETFSSRNSESQKMDTTEMMSFNETQNGVVLEITRQMSSEERLFLQTFTTIVYECVVHDKISLLPVWVSLYKAIEKSKKHPSSYTMWQIKLISSKASCKNFVEEDNKFFTLESRLAMKQKTAQVMDSWETELEPLVQEYVTTGTVEKKNEEILEKLSAYLTFFDIPYKTDCQLISDPFVNNQTALGVPIVTLHKLFKIITSQK